MSAARTATTETHELRERRLGELRTALRELLRTVNRLRGRDTHLAGEELSHAQFELLMELADRGPLAAGELATAARLTPGTVTQMLEHLAACGHVERVRSTDDKRVVVSRLTDQGRAKIEAKRASFQERWETALQDVDPRELRAAATVLERVSEMFEQAAAAEASAAPPQTPSEDAKTRSRPARD